MLNEPVKEKYILGNSYNIYVKKVQQRNLNGTNFQVPLYWEFKLIFWFLKKMWQYFSNVTVRRLNVRTIRLIH